MSLVLKGGRLVADSGEALADVSIEDGRIVEVGANLSGDTVLDASGCVISPGFVDLHTHLREPGKEDAETIETGSRAAALGGFTAVVAMPTRRRPRIPSRSSSSCEPRASGPGCAR
ncbi:MAG: amidohydrolase family protein [Ilumatobacteraceae bacterium]